MFFNINNKSKPYIDLYSRFYIILAAILFVLNYLQVTNLVYSKQNDLGNIVLKLFVFIFIISILYNMFQMDYYLPFLGYTVLPINQKSTNSNTTSTLIKTKATKVKISGLPPNVKVVYWAASSSDLDGTYTDPFTAYGSYENAGIIESDDQGNAIAELECPSQYYVPSKIKLYKRLLPRHIHYRHELKEYKGMFSKVFTQDLNENCE